MRIRKQQIIGKISLEKHMYSIGTDRFLEIMANALGLKTEALFAPLSDRRAL